MIYEREINNNNNNTSSNSTSFATRTQIGANIYLMMNSISLERSLPALHSKIAIKYTFFYWLWTKMYYLLDEPEKLHAKCNKIIVKNIGCCSFESLLANIIANLYMIFWEFVLSDALKVNVVWISSCCCRRRCRSELHRRIIGQRSSTCITVAFSFVCYIFFVRISSLFSSSTV